MYIFVMSISLHHLTCECRFIAFRAGLIVFAFIWLVFWLIIVLRGIGAYNARSKERNWLYEKDT